MTSAIHNAAHAQNLEAERSVLGAVLLDERHLHAALNVGLQDDDFYRPAHGSSVRRDAGAAQRRRGNRSPLRSLRTSNATENSTMSAAQRASMSSRAGCRRPDTVASTPRSCATSRRSWRLIRATYETRSCWSSVPRSGSDELIDEAPSSLIFQLRASHKSEAEQRLSLDAVTDEVDRLAQCLAIGPRRLRGSPTGIDPGSTLLLGGLQKRAAVRARRTPRRWARACSRLQLARHAAAVEGARALFASLEMSDGETAQRHLAALSGVGPGAPAPRAACALRTGRPCSRPQRHAGHRDAPPRRWGSVASRGCARHARQPRSAAAASGSSSSTTCS